MIPTQNPEGFDTFWGHLEELRHTILRSIFIILIASFFSLFFYQEIFSFLTAPLQHPSFHRQTMKHERVTNTTTQTQEFSLPPESQLISVDHGVTMRAANTYLIPSAGYISFEYPVSDFKLAIFSPLEGMFLTFKISLWVGLIVSSPIWLYFIFSFIAPALTKKTYQLITPFVSLSFAFMLCGFLFAYFLTIPLANEYLRLFNSDIGINWWSLSSYIDYTLTILLGNSIAFEGLVIGLFLVHHGRLTAKHLVNLRRHFIVFAFIIAAILTPPDILTQLMLAIPLCLFYEIIILYAKFKSQKKTLGEAQSIIC